MTRIGFRDADVEQRVLTRGFEIVPLLSPADLDRLREAYARHSSATSSGFHATMYDPSVADRRAVYESIRPLIAERTGELLRGYRPCVANYLVKEAGDTDSAVRFHQDWSFVDERRWRSINVWVPLVDVDASNGCLEVVAGSQRVSTDCRAHADACRFDQLAPVLRAGYTTAVPLQAGDAILYDGALLHCSPHNQSGARRVAVGAVLVPLDAPVHHCYRVAPGAVEVFAVEEDFFWRHTPGARPSGVPLLGVEPASTSQHTAAALDWLVAGAPAPAA